MDDAYLTSWVLSLTLFHRVTPTQIRDGLGLVSRIAGSA
jgi:hypothetical protein